MTSAVASLTPQPTLRRQPGQLVAGRFLIEQQLAEGGMGVVFRVRDERRGAQLALKQLRVQAGLPPSAVSAIGVQFEREFHTLSQLSHPCIIQVFDYGVDEGGAYYTMELLHGQDLRQRGKLPWREACPVLRDVASSLAILHSRRLLHRDVTARNVFCVEGGRAKLIDFGAMMTMGVAKHLVGTPPFVPLEALQQQSLDGRSDLYSLGALAYWLLTGTYAYPARSLAELRERFANPPPTLRQHDPELPEALDALVMSLLQLDRTARPSSAAEVMERLSGVAGLALEEHAQVSRAYLSTPTLVGRDEALERVQAELVSARNGTGTNVLIQGAAGSGRSRMLDACVLRAKLRGAVVLRSDAADAATGAYGIARALGLQLIEALPNEALSAARNERQTLAHLFPELVPRDAPTSAHPAAAPERRQLQTALRDFFLGAARHKHIVIAVDDLDRADEPSAAMLAALADGARRRSLNVLVTLAEGTAPSAALELLRQHSHALSLQPLAPTDTEQLLRSVFGDVPHVSALAERVHLISGGSPSVAMTLAEHLVDHGIARYEAGSWALPAQLQAEYLPSTAAAAIIARFESLPVEARELAEVLALTDPELVAPEHYASLSGYGDPGRTYRALETLTASGVLTLVGDRYRFAQFGAAVEIERQLTPERKRALHARLAQALQGSDHTERLAHHMLLGGQEQAAIERILAHFATRNAAGAGGLSLIQSALDAAERLRLPLRTRLELRTLLLHFGAQRGQYTVFTTHAEVLIRRLELDSGLFHYAQLPADMDPRDRMREALRRAAERHEATPPSERGFSSVEVTLNLFRVYGAFVTMSAIALDLELLERLPRLEPLAEHVPILRWLCTLIDMSLAFRAGRNDMGMARATELAGLSEDQGSASFIARVLRQSALYVIAQFAATSGQAKALEHVSELERVPGQRGNAWRVRMVYQLMQGDMNAAAECQRRAELLNLQDGGQLQLPGSTLRTELMAHMQSDNLIGVKRATEAVAELATAYPGWRPTLAIARCQYRRLQGDPSGALAELEPALQLRAGRHMDWWMAACAHVRVLLDLDRAADAVVAGESYIRTWEQEQLSSVDYGLQQVCADALLRSGRLEDARHMIERYIEMHERAGTQGLRLGMAYETRARVAIAMRDQAAVQEYARRCAQQYKGGRHLTLLNRYAQLVREADAGGIALTTGWRLDPDMQTGTLKTQGAETVHSRLQAAVSTTERVETALTLLLESSGATSGYLFGVRDGTLIQLVPTATPAPEAMAEWLETCLRSVVEADASTTMDSVENEPQGPQRFHDEQGRAYEAIPLSGRHKGGEILGGMAALHYANTQRRTPARGTIEALTDVLLADGTLQAFTTS